MPANIWRIMPNGNWTPASPPSKPAIRKNCLQPKHKKSWTRHWPPCQNRPAVSSSWVATKTNLTKRSQKHSVWQPKAWNTISPRLWKSYMSIWKTTYLCWYSYPIWTDPAFPPIHGCLALLSTENKRAQNHADLSYQWCPHNSAPFRIYLRLVISIPVRFRQAITSTMLPSGSKTAPS